ncbi:TetR/AcrR family transcriptional regulator [Rhodococcus sp. MSC1_016]|uniref:TetR/AcrR family transcriptional regulator n=1 Tax=Rhodococcus sp. MSC1_016 TaxID=2909266 RepID=UPI00031AFFC6|nr:TetR/AcrR family transcriptional regulator [Rhodococcus sp. MSC1_016]
MTPGPRERLIAGTIALVRERGVAGTGITELLARSGTARRSIYQNFPRGKEQLIEESTRVAGRLMSSRIAEFTMSGDPADGLVAFIQMWKDALQASDFTAGCPIVAAALCGPEVPAAPAVAAEVFGDWESLLSEQLERVGVDGPVARSLATTAVCAVEGAVIVALSSRSVQPLDRTGTHLAELIRLHLT